MPYQSHRISFILPNILLALKIMKLSVSFFSVSRHLLLPMSKYAPQHPVLEHSQSVFLRRCELPSVSLTPAHSNSRRVSG